MRTLLAALTALMLFAMPVVGGDFEDTKKAAEQGDAQAQEKVADLENFASLSNRAICGQALSGSNRLPAWEGAYDVFSEYVSEAKRRGLSPQQCARMLGRTTQVASTAKPSGSDKGLASRSNWLICNSTLELGGSKTEWGTQYNLNEVAEAQRRGLTPQRCAQIVGRTIQVAKEPNATSPKPPVLVMLDEDYLALKNANVRIGPGTNHASVARVTKGDAITALGKIKNQN